ncbi:MAG TPA: siphovirus Gp157 family protein [Polyangiales bacterium]
MKLYELTAEYAAIQEAAERGEDVGAALAVLGGAIEAKAEGLVHVLANLEADASALEAEAKRLQAKRKAAENQVERVRDYIRTCMLQAGVQRIKGPTFTITLAAGKERVEVESMDTLEANAPELVCRNVERAANKAEILARYKREGECIPGTRIVPTTTLTVR